MNIAGFRFMLWRASESQRTLKLVLTYPVDVS